MEDEYGMVKAKEGHAWWRGKRDTDRLISDAALENTQTLI